MKRGVNGGERQATRREKWQNRQADGFLSVFERTPSALTLHFRQILFIFARKTKRKFSGEDITKQKNVIKTDSLF